jgi:hypothetical protein
MPMPGARRRSLTPPAPLAEPTRPKACRLDPYVALPPRTCSPIGRVRWRPRCTAWTPGCPLIQFTTPTPTYGQTQLACPSRGSLCHCTSTPREHTHPAVAPTIISFPLSWCSLRCFYAMHGYKRRPPSASCPHQRRVRPR